MHFMTPMVPGLRFIKKHDEEQNEDDDNNMKICELCKREFENNGDIIDKMSASDINSKIDVLDGTSLQKSLVFLLSLRQILRKTFEVT